MKSFFVLLLVNVAFSLCLRAQQRPLFTQYMFNGLLINPAYSAVDEALNVTALSRHQWVGFEGAPNTQTLSLHSPVKTSNTSLGVILLRDQIGEVIEEQGFFLTGAQRVKVSEESYLALGLNFGFSRYTANYSKIADSDLTLDPTFNDQNSSYFNVGFGLTLHSKKFMLGFSSPYFYSNTTRESTASSTQRKAHYLLQGAYLVNVSDDVQIKPGALIKYVGNAPLQADLSSNVLIKEKVSFGISWRSFDSFDFMTEVQISPNLQLGYAYDFTTSELAKTNKGSHEIMLGFRLPLKGRSFPRCSF